MGIRFADLFCGCGGLGYGFHVRNDFVPILSVDHWSAAGKVFRRNFPNSPFEQADLSRGTERQKACESLKGNCDVLLGGPPCQGFSTLGKRRDDDRRSTLVDAFIKIALSTRPKIVILENVRGITSKQHPRGGSYADEA